MRHDYENAVANIICAYLQSVVSKATQQISPVVTFYDPMSIDEANRIVVMCPDGETENYLIGNGIMRVEVGIKSALPQKNMKSFMDAHFLRVKEVRDFLWDMQLVDKANTAAAEAGITGLMVNFVKPVRRMHTDVRTGWIYSETGFDLMYYVTEEN